ncbi:sulfatase [Schlesneria paludicola]|uniref:sulfatase n=1 Tax=Schlesneria paludicola TaxID=360056 RepID=UPI00029A83A3|nr:sulfatase [Schlesneria paludicola]
MRRRLNAVVVFAFVVGVVLGSWKWWQGSPRPNLLFVTLDTTRADRLGCYGYRLAKTPFLDQLAARGVVFENAYTAVPITLPSHATMFTGLMPPEHGLRINGTNQLPEDVTTLAQVLQRRGYRTGGFVSSLVLESRFGLSRGFDCYDDRLGSGAGGVESERVAEQTVSAALSWLGLESSKPFFCWVHLYDPHEPYRDHAEDFGDEFRSRPYDAELAYVDQHVGRILERLRHSRQDHSTVIVVAGDHGEGLGEHQESTHGYLAYNSTMRVPLIVVDPRSSQSGQSVTDPVSLVDLLPTVLRQLRITAPPGLTGHELPLFSSLERAGRFACYGESEAPYLEGGWTPLRTWTTSRWKFIQSKRPELYDLLNDPGELRNVLADEPDEAARLEQELTDWESQRTLRVGRAAVLSQDEQRALATLGYTAGKPPATPASDSQRDIKDTIVYAEQVHQCMHLIDRNDLQNAERILEAAVKALPDYPKAWGTLGICYARQENFTRAEDCYRRALTLDPHQNFARIALGRTLLAQDRFDEAREELRVAVRREPSAVDGQFFLGEVSRQLSQWEESIAAYTVAMKLAPDLVEARLGFADALRGEGKTDAAAQQYRAILKQHPRYVAAEIHLAELWVQSGRDDEAIRAYEGILERDPHHIQVLVHFSRLLSTSPQTTLRNPSRAKSLAELACRLTDHREVETLLALAAAQAAMEQVSQAVLTAQAALAVAQDGGRAMMILKAQRELAQYAAASSNANHGDPARP